MGGVDIVVADKSINIAYNDLSIFLDQPSGDFVLTDFVELIPSLTSKALGCKNTFGKTYWFIPNNPENPFPTGQMIPLTFRGQVIYALPVATWNGKPVTSLENLHALMKTCIL